MSDKWISVCSKKKKQKKKFHGSHRLNPPTPINKKPYDETAIANNLQETMHTHIETHQLNDCWVLWYHDLKNSDWSESAYEKIFSFNTVEDFWIVLNNLDDLTGGMYYLMRNGIPPIWDHEKTINGGAWSFKVDKRDLNNFWRDISCYCVGETICQQPDKIIGLSISPKIRFATVRVWTSDTNNDVNLFNMVMEESKTANVNIDFKQAWFSLNNQAAT